MRQPYEGYKFVHREVTGGYQYRQNLYIDPDIAVQLAKELNTQYGGTMEHWIEHNGRRISDTHGVFGTDDYLETYHD